MSAVQQKCQNLQVVVCLSLFATLATLPFDRKGVLIASDAHRVGDLFHVVQFSISLSLSLPRLPSHDGSCGCCATSVSLRVSRAHAFVTEA